jgi:hypothetical protein
MSPERITESEIWDLINNAYENMSLEQRRIWEVIKIYPQKWQSCFGPFWIVAIVGSTVIWYNDIEEGFNRSSFSELGKIAEYHCNQDELEWQIQGVINHLKDGYDSALYAGPPISNA